jgi:hypothetical protein
LIASTTTDFDKMRAANKVSLEDAEDHRSTCSAAPVQQAGQAAALVTNTTKHHAPILNVKHLELICFYAFSISR